MRAKQRHSVRAPSYISVSVHCVAGKHSGCIVCVYDLLSASPRCKGATYYAFFPGTQNRDHAVFPACPLPTHHAFHITLPATSTHHLHTCLLYTPASTSYPLLPPSTLLTTHCQPSLPYYYCLACYACRAAFTPCLPRASATPLPSLILPTPLPPGFRHFGSEGMGWWLPLAAWTGQALDRAGGGW